MMRKYIAFILLTFFYGATVAQTVTFNFPYLAGNEYSVHLFKATKTDTVQSGIIPADGRVTFTLPEKDKDYVGMIHLGLGKNGQSFVLNRENFSVTAAKPNPTENDIVFANSVENNYLKAQFKEQQVLFGKIDAVYRGEAAYANDNLLLPVFQKEFIRLNEQFTARQQEIAGSKLYAARYLQMVEFLNGLGSRLYAPNEVAAKSADLIRYFNDELSMDELYTSGLWNPVISATFELFTDKKAFAEAMVNNVKRVRSQEVFNVLATDLVTICEQFGWSDAENILIPYLVSSGRIQNPQGTLYYAVEMDKVKAGSKAAPIEGVKKLSNALLVFYESGCSNCQVQLIELKKHYAELEKKGIRVIAISADTSEEVFQYHSKDFPWPDNLCDYGGFEGVNFRNYAVVATPTLYLIDKKGIITGRYARLSDTGLLD
jgi:thiol-disulfide isomerase/thioredoxin